MDELEESLAIGIGYKNWPDENLNLNQKCKRF